MLPCSVRFRIGLLLFRQDSDRERPQSTADFLPSTSYKSIYSWRYQSGQRHRRRSYLLDIWNVLIINNINQKEKGNENFLKVKFDLIVLIKATIFLLYSQRYTPNV